MKYKKVNISPDAQQVMREDALRSFPDECCGFIYGSDDAERKVSIAVPVNNTKEGDKKRRFRISPFDYMQAELFAIENQLTLLGVYHSHPLHPAIASEHDREVAMPWFSYVILSTNGIEVEDVKSWQLDDNRNFVEERVILFPPVAEHETT